MEVNLCLNLNLRYDTTVMASRLRFYTYAMLMSHNSFISQPLLAQILTVPRILLDSMHNLLGKTVDRVHLIQTICTQQ
jgi:hypothetical protein